MSPDPVFTLASFSALDAPLALPLSSEITWNGFFDSPSADEDYDNADSDEVALLGAS